MNLEFIRAFYFPPRMRKFLKTPILGITSHIDYWILVHFIFGIALAMLLGPGKESLVLFLLIGYECIENTTLLKKKLTTYESPMNILLDICAGYIGYIMYI